MAVPLTQRDKFNQASSDLLVTTPQGLPPKFPEILKKRFSKEERDAIDKYDKEWEAFFKEQYNRERANVIEG